MSDSVIVSEFVKTINDLLDDLLGLDRTSNLMQVVAEPGVDPDAPDLTIEFRFSAGSWVRGIIDLLPIKIDTDRLLEDPLYTFELQAEIRKQLDPQIAAFVAKRLEGAQGVERGVIAAAANALEQLLSSQILQPLSAQLANGLLNLDLPRGSEIKEILGDALDGLGADYFRLFVPEIAKTYAKIGLSEILTFATTGSSPEWATAIRSVGDGVFEPIIDNIVHNYFLQFPGTPVKLFDNIEFSEVFGNAIAGLLIDFERLDKEILDDFLGLDGENKIEEWVEKLLEGKIQGLVESGFAEALEFLAGDFDAEDVARLFGQFTGQFDVQSLLGNFFVRYASQQLAELFVDIDSLPEALVSQLGATIGSSVLGKALGDLAIEAVTGLFGQATFNVIGGVVFKGLGAMLGAGVGAVAGSVVFELIDDLFDGAISDLFNDFLDWIRNDSPQAFYNMTYDPVSNRFEFGGDNYSKDSNDQMRLAVKMLGEAWAERVNQVIAFVDQPASFDPLYNNVYVVWGKKHYDSDYASFIGWEQRLAQSPDAEHVAKVTIGMVLNHMNFHSGHPIIAAAYELWKSVVGAGGGTALTFVEPDAMVRLQELIGLARFANDYRQDPTYFDLLMGSDAPVAITILQQYLEAEAKGFNAPVTLKGSVLGFETIGSAAAGDTIVLDGPAWRATGRGGDDTIVAGAATRQEIDGGSGLDTVVLGKDIGAYSATVDRPGRTVTLWDSAAGITIVIANVETFIFNGASSAFDAAFPNRAPVISSNGGAPAQIAIAENSLVVARIAAFDLDGDTPSFAISGGADAARFRIDPATGALSFAAVADYEAPADANGDNFYDVIVSVSDGQLTDSQALSIRVTDGIEGNVVTGTSSLDWIDPTHAPPGQPRSTDFDDVIHGADGGDLINAAGGADLVFGGRGDDVISGIAGKDQLFGGAGNDFLGGGPDDDLLSGEEGDDTLESGAGADLLFGGPGNDLYLVDAADQVFEAPGSGIDTVRSVVSFILGPDVENLVLVATGASDGTGNDLDNHLTGGGGANRLTGRGGDDLLDGGAGADWLSGGVGNDIFVVDDTGDAPTENFHEGTDEVRTALANYSLFALANIENLTGTSATGQVLTGNALANVIKGGGGNDVLHLWKGGGEDTALGGGGDDTFFFAGTLTSSDVVDGGSGNDTLVIQGDYAAGLTLNTNVTGIEALSLLAGSNTNFGEPGTNRYDYAITISDANFLSGAQVRINGSALLAGEDFTFNGAAENSASFVVYGGRGKDTLTGGHGNDIFFYAEERFATGDTVNGGAGYDGMFLRGNYVIDFNAAGYTGLFTNIENLTLSSATDERYARGGGTEFDYNLTLSNAIVKAGETLTISGALLTATETMVLDASREADGLLRLFGGRADDTLRGGGKADLIHGNLGADTLAGNGGADTFRYDSAADSSSASMDRILDFTAGADKIDLSRIDANAAAAGDQAFAWIGSSAFSGVAGQLRAFQSGGTWFVQGDTNGDSVADLVVALTLQGSAPLGAGDFLL